MRLVDVYLRGKKVFAVGQKGAGAFYIEGAPPLVASDTIDEVSHAIGGALEASVIPATVPRTPNAVSGLPAAAGVKDEAAFRKGAIMGTIRELDDKYELLRGQKESGGWVSRVVKTLPRSASVREVATDMLSILRGEVDEE